MNDFTQLLGFPFKDREWFVKMIVGVAITLIPIVNILSLGYFIRCINYSWRGIKRLPEWCNLKELFRAGCVSILIGLTYLIISVVLTLLLLMLPVMGSVFAAVIIFIMAIMVPLAVANYARHKIIKDAFRWAEIFRQFYRAASIYLVAWTGAVLVVMIGMTLLLSVPVWGFIGGLIIFYVGIVFATLLGLVVHNGC